MLSETSPDPVCYLQVAGIAAALGMKPATLSQAIWRNPDHPVPEHDAELLPGHGKGPDLGWLPSRVPDWKAWLDGLPGRGAGGGRPPGGDQQPTGTRP